MIQHHYEFICGTKTYSPRNTLRLSKADSQPFAGLFVIDDPDNQVGKKFNLFCYRDYAMPLAEFKALIVAKAAKLGFGEIDAAMLDRAQVIDEVANGYD